MPTIYHHGTDVNVTATATSTLEVVDMTPVGLVVTADDADTALFPEGEAVKMPDFSVATLAKVGTTGTFAGEFATLISQGYEPLCVVVRVAENADEAAVIAAVETLKAHSSHFGFDIKLVGAPGLETTTPIISKLATVATAIGGAAKAALAMCADYAAVVVERAKYDEKDLELFWPATHKQNGVDVNVATLAIAARVMVDKEKNIANSISSVRLKGGIDELSMAIDYKDVDSMANNLNKIQVSTVIRRSASDFCIYGARTTSTNANYTYEMWSRISNYIKERIKNAVNENIDGLVDADQLLSVESRVGIQVIDAAAQAKLIINGFFEFNDEKTTSETLQSGTVFYKFGFGPIPIFEQLKIEGDITLEYMDEIVIGTQTAG